MTKLQKSFFKKIPNILTNLRITFVPVICVMIYAEHHSIHGIEALRYAVVALTLLVCMTDCLDGRLARKYNNVTPYGKCMDPIADKLLVTSIIMMLVYIRKVWLIPAFVILFRELFISGVREFCSREKQITIPVSPMAKYKTILQMTSLIILLAFEQEYIVFCANILLSLSAILAVITAGNYTQSARKVFQGKI